MDRHDLDILIETQKCGALRAQWLAAVAARNELDELWQRANDVANGACTQLILLTGTNALEQVRQEEGRWRHCCEQRDDYAIRLDRAQASATELSKAYSDQQHVIDRLMEQRMARFWPARQGGGANNSSSGSRPQAPPPFPNGGFHPFTNNDNNIPKPPPPFSGGGSPFNFADNNNSSSSNIPKPSPSYPSEGFKPFNFADNNNNSSLPGGGLFAHFLTPTQERAREWYQTTQPAIEYANLTTFPTPPAFSGLGCQKVECKQNPSALAPACKCSVRAVFQTLNVDLKKERLRWHPDKFAVCRDTKMQEMAKEVFVVLEEMYNEA